MITNIKDVIKAVLKKKKLDVKLKNRVVMELWQEIVGLRIPVATKATSFRNGTLFVCVEDPTWAQELVLMKQHLIDEINLEQGDFKLNEIRVYVGKIEDNFNDQAQSGTSQKNIYPVKKRYVGDTVEIVDFEIMDNRYDKSLKSSKAKICEICGEENLSESTNCHKCDSLMDSDRVVEISSYIYEEPDMSFEEASSYVQALTWHEFAVAKKKVFDYKQKAVQKDI